MRHRTNTIHLKVQRYQPSREAEPHYDTFEIPVKPGMTVLDALFYVLEKEDGQIAFRYSCRSAVCGSCASFINGKQRLACNTQMSTLGSEVTIGPLPHLPIIRDLVVDLHPFFQKMNMVKPCFEGREPWPEKEYPQSPRQRETIDVAIDCIDCAACYSSCPMSWTDASYPGPAALVKAARFISDTRDGAGRERLRLVACEDGLWRCHTVFNCAEACPKSINPPQFIQYLKRRAALTR